MSAVSSHGDSPDPLENILSHRSIRDFADDIVSDDQLARWVRAGQSASTSSHVQAYCAIRVRDPGERAELARLAGGQPQVRSAGAFLIVCADTRRHWILARDAGTPCVENLESFLVAVIDASLFAQNLALAAESEGMGICYIGGLRNDLPAVDALLDLPAGVFPLFGLCLGRPAPPPAVHPDVKPRLPVDGVLFDGRYPGDDRIRDAIGRHDRAMGEHYAARGFPDRTWSGGVVRKRSRGQRPDLGDYYREKGACVDGAGVGTDPDSPGGGLESGGGAP